MSRKVAEAGSEIESSTMTVGVEGLNKAEGELG